MDGWKVAQFLLDNWMSIASFAGFVIVWFKTKDQTEKQKAQEAVFSMAVDAAKLAAEQMIENKERRQWAINTVVEAMPDKYKKFVDTNTVGVLVEKAWLTAVKPAMEKPKDPQ